jgi:hypothetical protein
LGIQGWAFDNPGETISLRPAQMHVMDLFTGVSGSKIRALGGRCFTANLASDHEAAVRSHNGGEALTAAGEALHEP